MKRADPPLTSAERSRRYRANHPEKKEEFRLHMKALRAVERQKRDLERLALVKPNASIDDPVLQAKILALTTIKKIATGLVQDENPSDAATP